MLWDKLKAVEERFEELAAMLSDNEIIMNRELFSRYSKEHKDLTEIVATFRAYNKAKEELAGSKEMIAQEKDQELRSLADEEIKLLEGELEGLEKKLQLLLLPKDPNDDKNVILEIRAGAGGDESGIFTGELFRLYTRFAENQKWKVEILQASGADAGGYKEVIAMITGQGAFSKLKYERGVHRVQRVPATESQGRIHTSTVTVAVLPEVEDVEFHIDTKDLQIDVYRASGAGGQHVNTTDSAVRITHIPTGVVVAMQDERSQHKNKDKAMRVLRARILEAQEEKANAERRDERRTQVGTGDRSEKIRTYNFPQGRVTDHRVGVSVYAIEAIMNGDLDQLIEPAVAFFQTEALKDSLSN